MVRRLPIFIVVLGVILVFSLAWLASATSVQAQCGTGASSCRTCHETDGQKRVSGNAAWHADVHANVECSLCHAGNKASSDKATAHIGVINNLNDEQPYCQNCHTEDLAARVQVYAAALNVTVGTPSPTATPNPAIGSTGSQPPGGPSTAFGKTPQNPTGNLILIGIIIALMVGGGGYIYWNEKLSPKKLEMLPLENETEAAAVAGISSQVSALLPALQRLGPGGIEALDALLEDPVQAEKIFVKLVDIDLDEIFTPWGSLRTDRLVQALEDQAPEKVQP